jgi:hypothetical protein
MHYAIDRESAVTVDDVIARPTTLAMRGLDESPCTSE